MHFLGELGLLRPVFGADVGGRSPETRLSYCDVLGFDPSALLRLTRRNLRDSPASRTSP